VGDEPGPLQQDERGIEEDRQPGDEVALELGEEEVGVDDGEDIEDQAEPFGPLEEVDQVGDDPSSRMKNPA
jgi:hypothetical protein